MLQPKSLPACFWEGSMIVWYVQLEKINPYSSHRLVRASTNTAELKFNSNIWRSTLLLWQDYKEDSLKLRTVFIKTSDNKDMVLFFFKISGVNLKILEDI